MKSFPQHITHPWLAITSVGIAERLLTSEDTVPEIGAVVSIADPYLGHRPPERAFRRVPQRLVLSFDDCDENTEDGEVAPSMSDAHRIVRFVRKCSLAPGQRALVHCYAGLSRSTAVGLIWLAVNLGPGREEEAAKMLLDACYDKEPIPNLTLVSHADAHLGRQGALLAQAKRFYRIGALLAGRELPDG